MLKYLKDFFTVNTWEKYIVFSLFIFVLLFIVFAIGGTMFLFNILGNWVVSLLLSILATSAVIYYISNNFFSE